MHELLEVSADHLASRTWRWAGARSEAELRGSLITRYRRRVGVRAVKAFAAYRLERIPFIGMPRHLVEGIRRDRVREPVSADIPSVAFRAMADADALEAIRNGGMWRMHGGLGAAA